MTRRLIVAILLLGACQPDAAPPFLPEEESVAANTEATCSTAFSCECPLLPWPDEEACTEFVGMRNGETEQVAADAGLSYDGVCVGRRLERLEAIGCATQDVEAERIDACQQACKRYVGTVAEAEPCERYGVLVDLDNCAQGLRCGDDKTCVPICEYEEPAGEGERCMAGIEELARCEDALFCDGEDGRCRVAAAIGEPCDERPCARDAVCDAGQQPRTCVTRFAPGEVCGLPEQCSSGLCIDDVCAPVVPLACGV